MISVIVAIYNVEKYLQCCLQSIASQTYKDFEVILMDDGSTDGSSKICDSFSKNDNRFHVIHQVNQGVASARNNGLIFAKGEYVLFVDGDDYAHPRLLETLYYAIKNTGCPISMVKGKMVFSMDEYESDGDERLQILQQDDLIAGLFGNSSSDWQYMVVWNKLFTRKVIENIPFRQIPADDMEYNLRVLLRNDEVAFVNKVLYYWVQRSGSITHSGITQKYIDTIDTYLSALSYLPEEKEKWQALCLIKLYKRILSIRHDAKGTPNEYYAAEIIEKAEKMTFAKFIHNRQIPLAIKTILWGFYRIPLMYNCFRWYCDRKIKKDP